MTEHRTTRSDPLDDASLQDAAVMFGMLAASARIQIVWLLRDGERDVGTLAEGVGQSVAAVSQHLAKLKIAGIVRSRKVGRRQVYLVTDSAASDVVALALRDRAGTRRPPKARRG